MAYGEDETGYGRALDATHVCIANLPLTGGLMLYDIVTLHARGAVPDCGHAGAALLAPQRCAANGPQAQLTYLLLQGADQGYANLYAAGCAVESTVPGIAMLNAPADVDVLHLLAPLGLVEEDIDVYQEEDA